MLVVALVCLFVVVFTSLLVLCSHTPQSFQCPLGRVILHPHRLWLPVPERRVSHKNVIAFSACFLSLLNGGKNGLPVFCCWCCCICVLFIPLFSALVPAADV